MKSRMITVLALILAAAAGPVLAQTTPAAPPTTAKPTPAPTAKPSNPLPGTIEPPPGYVIGVEDVLTVDVWREKDYSAEAVMVGPDGTVSLPVINQIPVAGLTLAEATARITAALVEKAVKDPTVTVGPKAINSRKVFIFGNVGKSGPYQLMGPMTVTQLIATAGGLAEFADEKNIRVTRTERGKKVQFVFNYKDYKKGKGLDKDIELKVGDVVNVP
jgi:polysaccharide export outer membrane protein